MTESERDEQANTLINCVAAVFKQLKSRDPAAHPWVGNMLATEHLRQMGTSVFIQITRRGIDPPAAVSSHGSVPAAQRALTAQEKGQLDEATRNPRAKQPRDPRAPMAPAKAKPFEINKGDAFVCPECNKAKVWRMDWPATPSSVCIDCYKAGLKA